MFICIERSTHLSGVHDDPPFARREPDRLLTCLTGDTTDEVRKKLNAYLASPEGIAAYGKALTPMPPGVAETVPEIAVRNGFNWEWSFKITEHSKEVYQRPVPPRPVRDYVEAN